MDQPVLVTGYGGFLGAAICRWLIDHGYNVRGIARNRYPDLVKLGVEAIEGDLRSKEDVAKACKGIRGIIHTAAIAGVWGKTLDLREHQYRLHHQPPGCSQSQRYSCIRLQ